LKSISNERKLRVVVGDGQYIVSGLKGPRGYGKYTFPLASYSRRVVGVILDQYPVQIGGAIIVDRDFQSPRDADSARGKGKTMADDLIVRRVAGATRRVGKPGDIGSDDGSAGGRGPYNGIPPA
jgi:hypothetical protein